MERYIVVSYQLSKNVVLLVATLLVTRPHEVIPRTGWPGVSILTLGEIASLICTFYLRVAAFIIVEEKIACC